MNITFEKPGITDKEKKIQSVWFLLYTSEFVTKRDIAELLNWDAAKRDRQIRDIIAEISKEHPIISTSDNNKGYKLAQSPSDCDMVKHTLMELLSRIDELRKRTIPLQKFLKHNNESLTLFD